MNADSNQQLPLEIDQAVLSAVERDSPGRIVQTTRLCADEAGRFVVRVYLLEERIKPTPYVIYAVDRATLVARELTGRESEPYLIPNYK